MIDQIWWWYWLSLQTSTGYSLSVAAIKDVVKRLAVHFLNDVRCQRWQQIYPWRRGPVGADLFLTGFWMPIRQGCCLMGCWLTVRIFPPRSIKASVTPWLFKKVAIQSALYVLAKAPKSIHSRTSERLYGFQWADLEEDWSWSVDWTSSAGGHPSTENPIRQVCTRGPMAMFVVVSSLTMQGTTATVQKDLDESWDRAIPAWWHLHEFRTCVIVQNWRCS